MRFCERWQNLREQRDFLGAEKMLPIRRAAIRRPNPGTLVRLTLAAAHFEKAANLPPGAFADIEGRAVRIRGPVAPRFAVPLRPALDHPLGFRRRLAPSLHQVPRQPGTKAVPSPTRNRMRSAFVFAFPTHSAARPYICFPCYALERKSMIRVVPAAGVTWERPISN